MPNNNDLILITRTHGNMAVAWQKGSLWRVTGSPGSESHTVAYLAGPRPLAPYDTANSLGMYTRGEGTDWVVLTADMVRAFRRTRTAEMGDRATDLRTDPIRLVVSMDVLVARSVGVLTGHNGRATWYPEGDEHGWGAGFGSVHESAFPALADHILSTTTEPEVSQETGSASVEQVTPNMIRVRTDGETTVETREEDGLVIETRTTRPGTTYDYVRVEAVQRYVNRSLARNGLGAQAADLWTMDFYDTYDSGIDRWSAVGRYTHEGMEYAKIEDIRTWLRSLRAHYSWCSVSESVMQSIEDGLSPWLQRVDVTVNFTFYPESFDRADVYSDDDARRLLSGAIYGLWQQRDSATVEGEGDLTALFNGAVMSVNNYSI